MNQLASLAFGAGLAISLAVPPGPINAMIASTSTSSRLRGTAIGLGAMTADATFLLLVLILHSAIPAWLVRPISFIGGALLVYLGYSILLKNRQVRVFGGHKGSYLSGVVVGLSNPYQFGWWLTAGLSMVAILGYGSVAGFFGGLLVWVILFPYTLNRVSKKYRETFPAAVRVVSGLAVLLFGAFFILSALLFWHLTL